jgi:hypothetical protein
MRGMKCQNRDAGGQLFQGQQGIPVEFLGDGSGGELRREASYDCFLVFPQAPVQKRQPRLRPKEQWS